jgi:hypothetical protein
VKLVHRTARCSLRSPGLPRLAVGGWVAGGGVRFCLGQAAKGWPRVGWGWGGRVGEPRRAGAESLGRSGGRCACVRVRVQQC